MKRSIAAFLCLPAFQAREFGSARRVAPLSCAHVLLLQQDLLHHLNSIVLRHPPSVCWSRSCPPKAHCKHYLVSCSYNDSLPACGAAGCPTVVGVFLEETEDEAEANPFIKAIFDVMPKIENVSRIM